MAELIVTETLLQDTYISPSGSQDGWGDQESVFVVSSDAGSHIRSLTTFSFTQPPAGATVVSAILTRYCIEKVGAGGGTYNRSLSGITYDLYDENLANWETLDGTTQWATAGHSSAISDYDISPQPSYTWPAEGFTGSFTTSINTSIIVDAIASGEDTLTIFERAQSETTTNRSLEWASKDHATTAWRPTLVITYEVPAEPPTVTTDAVASITGTTADCGGEVTDDGGDTVTERGICWATTTGPTTSDSTATGGSGTGTFDADLSGLTPGTHYYVRAYAINSAGTAYGNEVEFDTATLPTVITDDPVTDITGTTAESGGEVTDDGGATVTSRGVCWRLNSETPVLPTIADAHTVDGSGEGVFTSSITGLTPNAGYLVRAYATNSVGTAYGEAVIFQTDSLALVVTEPATNITGTTADSGGEVINDGGDSVTERGVCWNTTGAPTLDDDFTSDGTGTGTFVSGITGLTLGTTYYVRAYATNAVGTAYGNTISFTTVALPTITTKSATSITEDSASSGGTISDDGGESILEKGVCWNTSGTPTIADDTTSDGTGTATFNSSLTGLTPSTTYHVRAYATNIAGTGYGNEVVFTTLDDEGEPVEPAATPSGELQGFGRPGMSRPGSP